MHRPLFRLTLLFGAALLITSCVSSPPEQSGVALEAAARTFMATYADDLRRHDRSALGARYDPRGAYLIGDGTRQFLTADAVAAFYRDDWEGPDSFAWTDLVYEPLPPSAVVVVGGFRWKTPVQRKPVDYVYTSLLVLHGGRLRIRVENENIHK